MLHSIPVEFTPNSSEMMNAIAVVALMVLAWYVVATLFLLIAMCLMHSLEWPWLAKSFEPIPGIERDVVDWAAAHHLGWKSIHGATAGAGGNSAPYEIGTMQDGIVIRTAMYLPPFVNLWRWPFADRLFSPCLIRWDRVTAALAQECIVQSKDEVWPTMAIRTSTGMLKKIARQLELISDDSTLRD